MSFLKDFRPSDKFDNLYFIIPRVTNDNSVYLWSLVSGTCFRVLGTLLYLHEHCPFITYYCSFCQSFVITLQKCQPSAQIYNIHIVILFFSSYNLKLCLDIFCTTFKDFFLIIVFLRKYYYKRKITLPNLQERIIKIIYYSLKCTA